MMSHISTGDVGEGLWGTWIEICFFVKGLWTAGYYLHVNNIGFAHTVSAYFLRLDINSHSPKSWSCSSGLRNVSSVSADRRFPQSYKPYSKNVDFTECDFLSEKQIKYQTLILQPS